MLWGAAVQAPESKGEDIPLMENRSGSGRSYGGRQGSGRTGQGQRSSFKRDQDQRGGKRPFQQRRDGDSSRQQGSGYRGPRSDEAPREKILNPRDLRSANRSDRGRSPDIDEDITGKELDRPVLREIGSLDEKNQPWVAKHLVMAGRLLNIDPQLAFEHALAASRRGGRIGCVREAVALTAYAAGDYAEALREFRTYRRITGDQQHLAAIVDCERALGRPEKALESAAEADLTKLSSAGRVDLALVLSGIHDDLGDFSSALAALEIPELNPKRAFPYSPALFSSYADALDAAGRGSESERWRRLALAADEALGQGFFAEPEIVDFDGEPNQEHPRARDIIPPAGRRSDAPAENDPDSPDSALAPSDEQEPDEQGTDEEPQEKE
ncbi:MAG: hypothetical protein ACTHZ5_13400 [Micrococcaceae bacterium]